MCEQEAFSVQADALWQFVCRHSKNDEKPPYRVSHNRATKHIIRSAHILGIATANCSDAPRASWAAYGAETPPCHRV